MSWTKALLVVGVNFSELLIAMLKMLYNSYNSEIKWKNAVFLDRAAFGKFKFKFSCTSASISIIHYSNCCCTNSPTLQVKMQ